MRCHVIVSPITGTKQCLLVREGTLLTDLPKEIQAKFMTGKTKTIDLHPDDRRAALDGQAAYEAIETDGYYIAGAIVCIEETVSPKREGETHA